MRVLPSVNRFLFNGPPRMASLLDGQNTAQATVGAPGTYQLVVTDGQNGCMSNEQVDVDFSGLEINDLSLIFSGPSCPGDKDGQLQITAVSGGTGPYLYALNDGNFRAGTQFTNLSSGTYELKVMDATGCETDTTFTLEEPEGIHVDLGPDLSVSRGQEVRLVAETNVKDPQSVNWMPSELATQQDTLIQVLQLDRTSTFRVIVTNENACTGEDEIRITVNNDLPVYLANAFSPNGDGENDVFYIQANSAITEVESFLIFDRWGDKIFERNNFSPNDPSFGWDGKHNGQLLSQAVFVYVAVVKLASGETEQVAGEVVLVR